MATNLRNFRIDDETWEKFKAVCSDDGTNASQELLAFCRARIAGYRLPTTGETSVEATVPTDVDSRIQAAIAPLVSRVEALETELGKDAA